jgi:EpsD family peptidyl-prolyl cis-trans isomerase
MLSHLKRNRGIFMRKDVVIGLSLILACSACDKKPEGQTLAVVNGEEITSSELNGELANANLPAGVDKKQATSRILQGLIDRRLLAEQARKDGVDRSPEFITRQQRMNEDLLIGMMANRQIDTGKLPTEAEITALQNKLPFAFAKREVWKLQQLQYETPTDAAINNRILQTKTLDQLAAVLTASRIPFQRANNQLVTSVVPPEMYPRLAALAPGEPFIVPAGNRSVASAIVEREPAPLVGAPARTEAVNIIRRQNGTQLLQQRLKSLRQSAEIEYKEGFAPPK